MDKVDYYFQHYQDAKRDLIIAKNLIENYKPISEDAFLYSLATRQTNEERVKMSKLMLGQKIWLYLFMISS